MAVQTHSTVGRRHEEPLNRLIEFVPTGGAPDDTIRGLNERIGARLLYPRGTEKKLVIIGNTAIRKGIKMTRDDHYDTLGKALGLTSEQIPTMYDLLRQGSVTLLEVTQHNIAGEVVVPLTTPMCPSRVAILGGAKSNIDRSLKLVGYTGREIEVMDQYTAAVRALERSGRAVPIPIKSDIESNIAGRIKRGADEFVKFIGKTSQPGSRLTEAIFYPQGRLLWESANPQAHEKFKAFVAAYDGYEKKFLLPQSLKWPPGLVIGLVDTLRDIVTVQSGGTPKPRAAGTMSDLIRLG